MDGAIRPLLDQSTAGCSVLDVRGDGGAGGLEQSGRGLSLPPSSGAFCEHCLSPENCAAILVELRSSPKREASLRPFQIPCTPVAPVFRH